MKRYKIREEREGAMIFDMDNGRATMLSEDEYLNALQTLKNYILIKSDRNRTELPRDCTSAPSKVYFEITRHCNLSCKYCYNRSNIDFDKELPKERIFELVDEMNAMGVFEIRLTGGEPTCHAHFFEIVDYIEKKGVWLSLSTNAIWSDELIDKICATGIKTIITSIDGPEIYHDMMRGAGTFQRVTYVLKKLKKANRFDLKINMVVCKKNKQYISEVVRLANTLGVDGVNFAPLRPAGRANELNSCEELTNIDMLEIVKEISSLRQWSDASLQTYYDILDSHKKIFPSPLMNSKSCAAGIEVGAISPFGDVYGCVVSPANELSETKSKELFTAGNITESKFRDIWLDSKRWKVYRDMDYCKCEDCLACVYYGSRCFGNCVVESYVNGGNPKAKNKLCFADLI